MNSSKRANLKLMILVLLSIISFMINYICFRHGVRIIVQNIFFVPILFASYWLEKTGFAYAVGISFTYFVLSLTFSSEVLGIKVSRLLFFLLISWLMYRLSSTIQRQNRVLSEVNNRLQHELLRSNAAEKIAHIGSWEIDLHTGKTTWSDELFRIFGFEPSAFEPTKEKRIELTYPDDQDYVRETIKKTIHEHYSLEIESRILKVDGSKRWVLSMGYVITDEFDEPLKYVGTLQDITEKKLRQDEVLYISYHDSLTGLFNRRFFDEELLRSDREENLPISIIIIDINRLKLINDAFGHRQGDKLLQRVAEALKGSCRKEDILARWGGDEFIVLLPKTTQKEAQEVINRMKSSCGSLCADLIKITASFGLDVKDKANEEMHIVIKNAENEMYINKTLESKVRGSAINLIINTLHEKNPREEQHSERVSTISQIIGKAMGLSETEINKLKALGLLHDIGKIAIEERVLNKPEELTEAEWKEIKRHPDIGYRILKSSTEMSELAEYVLAHHERFDGSGYPRGLKTEEIPLLSRIVSVADAYDAMTSDRSYRKALDKRSALDELIKNKGRQFDPQIVDAFVCFLFSNIKQKIIDQEQIV